MQLPREPLGGESQTVNPVNPVGTTAQVALKELSLHTPHTQLLAVTGL